MDRRVTECSSNVPPKPRESYEPGSRCLCENQCCTPEPGQTVGRTWKLKGKNELPNSPGVQDAENERFKCPECLKTLKQSLQIVKALQVLRDFYEEKKTQ